MEPNKDDELLTPEEIATELKVNVRTVYDYIQRGKFPNVKNVGRSYRIRRKDFNEFLEQSTAQVFPQE